MSAARNKAPLPIKCAFIVPKDYPPFIDFDLAFGIVQKWVGYVQEWFRREVGLTFDCVPQRWNSSHLITEITLDGCAKAPVPQGQGWSGLFNYDARTGLNWPAQGSIDNNREWFVGVGGGGFAEGWFQGHGKQTYGFACVGDRGLEIELTGLTSPCDAWNPGIPWPASDGWKGFGHEILHSMNVECHDPVLWGGDVLPQAQRQQLTSNNKAFLYAPPSLGA